MADYAKDFEEATKRALDDLCRATIGSDPLMRGLHRKMGMPHFISPRYDFRDQELQLNYTWQIKNGVFIVYSPRIEIPDCASCGSSEDSEIGSTVTVNRIPDQEDDRFKLELAYWFNVNQRLSCVSSEYGAKQIPREILPIKQSCDSLNERIERGQEIDRAGFLVEFNPVVDHLRRITGSSS